MAEITMSCSWGSWPQEWSAAECTKTRVGGVEERRGTGPDRAGPLCYLMLALGGPQSTAIPCRLIITFTDVNNLCGTSRWAAGRCRSSPLLLETGAAGRLQGGRGEAYRPIIVGERQ